MACVERTSSVSLMYAAPPPPAAPPPCIDLKPTAWCREKASTSCGMPYVASHCGFSCGSCLAPPSPPLPPPPPASPPPPPAGSETAARLNARFAAVRSWFGFGRPTLTTAGVSIHQFDTIDDNLGVVHGIGVPREESEPWLLSSSTYGSRPEWSDRISAALIHAKLQAQNKAIATYSNVNSGVVLSPAHNRLLCAYASDGSTQSRRCVPTGLSDSCTPGCSTLGRENGPPTWCNRSLLVASLWQRWDFELAKRVASEACAWGPSELDQMVALQLQLRLHDDRKRYNEMVFLTDTFTRCAPSACALPHTGQPITSDSRYCPLN